MVWPPARFSRLLSALLPHHSWHQPPAAFQIFRLRAPSSLRAFTRAVPSTSLLSPSPPPLLQLTPTQLSCLRKSDILREPFPSPWLDQSPRLMPCLLPHNFISSSSSFFWPQSGIELPPPEGEEQSLNRWTTREVPLKFVVMLSWVDNDNNS